MIQPSVEDYINAVVGAPWVFAGNSYGGFDCWGLVEHSFLELDGLQLPAVEPRDDVHAAFLNVDWVEPCGWKEGAIVGCFDENGNMFHVGRILNDHLVHALGNVRQGESVVAWDKRMAYRVFTSGGRSIQFFEVTL